jgi:phosphinothricin acetyltransferase
MVEPAPILPRLRNATPDDAEAIARIYSPFVSDTAVSFEEEPPTPEEIADRITKVLPTFPWLVAEVQGELAGYAYASQHRPRGAYRWSVDVSVYLDSRFRRLGIGSRLYRRLLDILRLQGYYNAYAGITQPNVPSVRLHESMGFRLVGLYDTVGYKLGVWHTVGWWQLELQPKGNQPTDPVPFAKLEISHTK